jgi:hypothetical protein
VRRVCPVVQLFAEPRLILPELSRSVTVATGGMGKAKQTPRSIELLGCDQHPRASFGGLA